MAAKVKDFHAHEVANTPGAIAKTSRVRPEVLDSVCRAAAARPRTLTRKTLPTR